MIMKAHLSSDDVKEAIRIFLLEHFQLDVSHAQPVIKMEKIGETYVPNFGGIDVEFAGDRPMRAKE